MSEKHYEKQIKSIRELVANKLLAPETTLDALENIRDFCEEWIDAIQSDIDTAAAELERERDEDN